MIYWLIDKNLDRLEDLGLGFLRVFTFYATFRGTVAIVVSFLISLLLGPRVIRWLRNQKIADLAGFLSTSPATLNRRFHQALGLSPKAYVGQLRFQAAVRMLEKSTRSVDRIAQLVGYSDSRLFRAMFRQHAGVTATQWRAGLRGTPGKQADAQSA